MEAGFFDGTIRPTLIPKNWLGRPLNSGKGWCWYDPSNDGNAVFMYRGDMNSSNPTKRDPYVVVVRDGVCLDRESKPIPNSSMPKD